MPENIDFWEISVLNGCSLVNFCEQNFDDQELSILIDGCIHWSRANCPDPDDADRRITQLFNTYSAQCIEGAKSDPGNRDAQMGLQAQERVIDVLKNLLAKPK